MPRMLWVLCVAPFCVAAEFDSIKLASDAGLRTIFADLVRRGGNGLKETEVAAFIVLDGEGRYRCIVWPYTGATRRQTYRGSLPPFTVAIAHTHHLSSVRPSGVDRRTSAALGIPVIVLTPANIWVATPGGSIAAIVHRRPWMDGVEPPGARPARPPIQALSGQ